MIRKHCKYPVYFCFYLTFSFAEINGSNKSITTSWKKILTSCLVLSIPLIQAEDTTSWQSVLGGVNDDFGSDLALTDSGSWSIGSTDSYGAGDSDLFLAQYSSQGNLEASYTIGGAKEDVGTGIAIDFDKIWITGYTKNKEQGDSDALLIQMDIEGRIIWSQSFGEQYEEKGYKVLPTKDKGAVVIGSIEREIEEEIDIFIVKFGEEGRLIWSEIIKTGGDDHAFDIALTDEEDFIVVGETLEEEKISLLVAKISGEGLILWGKNYRNAGSTQGYGVTLDRNGTILITGATNSDNLNGSNILLLTLDSNGEKIEARAFGGKRNEIGRSIKRRANGGIALLASTDSYGSGGQDVWLMPFNQIGILETAQIWGDQSDNIARSLEVKDDSFFIVGERNSVRGEKDILFIKLNEESSGCSSVATPLQEDITSNISSILLSLPPTIWTPIIHNITWEATSLFLKDDKICFEQGTLFPFDKCSYSNPSLPWSDGSERIFANKLFSSDSEEMALFIGLISLVVGAASFGHSIYNWRRLWLEENYIEKLMENLEKYIEKLIIDYKESQKNQSGNYIEKNIENLENKFQEFIAAHKHLLTKRQDKEIVEELQTITSKSKINNNNVLSLNFV